MKNDISFYIQELQGIKSFTMKNIAFLCPDYFDKLLQSLSLSYRTLEELHFSSCKLKNDQDKLIRHRLANYINIKYLRMINEKFLSSGLNYICKWIKCSRISLLGVDFYFSEICEEHLKFLWIILKNMPQIQYLSLSANMKMFEVFSKNYNCFAWDFTQLKELYLLYLPFMNLNSETSLEIY